MGADSGAVEVGEGRCGGGRLEQLRWGRLDGGRLEQLRKEEGQLEAGEGELEAGDGGSEVVTSG